MSTVILFPGQKQRSMCSAKCVCVQLINSAMAVMAVVMFYVIVEGERRRRDPHDGVSYGLDDGHPYAAHGDVDVGGGDPQLQLADLQERMQKTKRELHGKLERLQQAGAPPECGEAGGSECVNPTSRSKAKRARKKAKAPATAPRAESPPDEAPGAEATNCDGKDQPSSSCSSSGKAGGKKPSRRRGKKKAQLSP